MNARRPPGAGTLGAGTLGAGTLGAGILGAGIPEARNLEQRTSAGAALRQRHAAEQLGGRLPPLLVAADRVASTVAQGVHGRRRVGQGESFWQFRPYAPGDATSRIDWRESGKSDRTFIRENEWEAAQSAWLWRDASASMDYSSTLGLQTKRARAELLLLALASLLLRGGERVALLGGEAPTTGRMVLERMSHRLLRGSEPAGRGLPPMQPLPRYGTLVLIGDFLTPLDQLDPAMRRFAGLGVAGHMLQVLDPAEETLPFEGRVRFDGLEAEGSTLVNRVSAIRQSYQERLAAHEEGLAAIARRAGWSFARHRTDRPPHTALLGLYHALTERRGR